MAVAYNKQTGEAMRLDESGQWVKTKIAKNPQTGETLALDGGNWTAVDSPGMIERGWNTVKDAFTGDSRREFDLPELGTSGPSVPALSKEGLRMMGAYATTADPKGIADIATKTLPGASQKADKFGNPIVTFEGKDYYVNRPGLSGADVFKFAADLPQYAPATAAGLAVPGRVLGAVASGAGYGATSLAQDKASQALGSEQPADMGNAAAAAVGGAVARFIDPELSSLVNRLIPKPGVVDAQGNLTARGRELVTDLGLDPDMLSQAFAARFGRMAQRTGQPGPSATLADAQTLPVPVPMRQGQVTGSPSDQMFESLSRKGAYGPVAERVMAGSESAQREALEGNIEAIQRQLGPGDAAPIAPGQGGRAAQEQLLKMNVGEKAGVDQAYKQARETFGAVPSDYVRQMDFDIRNAVAADHTLNGLARTNQILDDFNRITQTDGDASTFVRELFDWRKRASAARSTPGEEGVAIGKAVKEFDRRMDAAIGDAIVQGDDAAIDAFKTAIAKNREYASRFKGGDLVELLTAKEPRSGVMQLAVPPDQAANVIFGSKKVFGGTNTARDLARMKQMLGPDSAEWKQLREEAWLRLVRAGEGAVDPMSGSRQFSGAKFASNFDNAVRDQADLMRTLFTQDEINLMNQFKRVAARTTGTVKGGDNYSNTTVAASNIVQNLLGKLFVSEGAAARFMAVPVVNTLYQGAAGIRAAGSTVPRLQRSGAQYLTGPAIESATETNQGRD